MAIRNHWFEFRCVPHSHLPEYLQVVHRRLKFDLGVPVSAFSLTLTEVGGEGWFFFLLRLRPRTAKSYRSRCPRNLWKPGTMFRTTSFVRWGNFFTHRIDRWMLRPNIWFIKGTITSTTFKGPWLSMDMHLMKKYSMFCVPLTGAICSQTSFYRVTITTSTGEEMCCWGVERATEWKPQYETKSCYRRNRSLGNTFFETIDWAYAKETRLLTDTGLTSFASEYAAHPV